MNSTKSKADIYRQKWLFKDGQDYFEIFFILVYLSISVALFYYFGRDAGFLFSPLPAGSEWPRFILLGLFLLIGFVFFCGIKGLSYLLISRSLKFSDKGIFLGRDWSMFGKLDFIFHKIRNKKDVFIQWTAISTVEPVIKTGSFIPWNYFLQGIKEELVIVVKTKNGDVFEKRLLSSGRFKKEYTRLLEKNKYVPKIKKSHIIEESAYLKNISYLVLVGIVLTIAVSLLIQKLEIPLTLISGFIYFSIPLTFLALIIWQIVDYFKVKERP